MARDQCDLVPRPVLTQPDAQAVISVSMDLSKTGNGNFGCGAPVEGKGSLSRSGLMVIVLKLYTGGWVQSP